MDKEEGEGKGREGKERRREGRREGGQSVEKYIL